jgi:hypothetical protein
MLKFPTGLCNKRVNLLYWGIINNFNLLTTHTMTETFEAEKNRKAFTYTAIICGTILLLFIIIKWKVEPVSVPIIQDLIEIKLGNELDGFGEKPPLIKGNRTPQQETSASKQVTASGADDEKVNPDNNAEKDAAPVVKAPNNNAKIKSISPTEKPLAKPQKPKLTYKGPQTGPPGNNDKENNDSRSFGKTPDGKNDEGALNGKIGGFIVKKGRQIKSFGNYTFPGNLGKETIYAIIKVSPEGRGTFVTFDKGSTSRSQVYADAIRNCLPTIKFFESDQESLATVQFNFNINQ